MRKIAFNDALLKTLLCQAETTRVLEMAGAKNMWAHTRTEGVLDGVQFQLRQTLSPIYNEITNKIDASFILVLDKAITTALEKEEEMTQRIFSIRFDDLLKGLAEAVKAMGYGSVEMEFGANLRFNLRNFDLNEKPLQDPATALKKMRTDVPKIRQLFDTMNTEVIHRIQSRK